MWLSHTHTHTHTYTHIHTYTYTHNLNFFGFCCCLCICWCTPLIEAFRRKSQVDLMSVKFTYWSLNYSGLHTETLSYNKYTHTHTDTCRHTHTIYISLGFVVVCLLVHTFTCSIQEEESGRSHVSQVHILKFKLLRATHWDPVLQQIHTHTHGHMQAHTHNLHFFGFCCCLFAGAHLYL